MSLSLLFPPNAPRAPRPENLWLGDSLAHLGVEELIKALAPRFYHQRQVREHLLNLCSDAATIEHRQAVLEDLLQLPALTTQLEKILPELAELHTPSFRSTLESTFYQTLWRLAELETYVTCVRQLSTVLEAAHTELRSPGLLSLLEHLRALQKDTAFQSLAEQLPELGARIRGVQSITVGINLDSHLRPREAALLSVNTHRFKNDTLLGRLFERDDVSGLAPLRAVLRAADGPPPSNSELRLSPLFRDLEEVLGEIAKPIANTLAQYRGLNVRVLQEIEPELAFYIYGVRLIEKMQASGLKMCRAEILPTEARTTEVHGLFNLLLAARLQLVSTQANLGEQIVTSDVAFNAKTGRLAILTGPNRGGKTTFTQALGLAHLLFQAGLYVPSEAARLSPVEAIYLHFATAEKFEVNAGRLGEEAQRVSEIFRHAGRHSLILFNESFASTTPGEGLYLALDVVRGLRLLGARGVFVTHFHELAKHLDEINTAPGESTVFSLVTGVTIGDSNEAVKRTFKVQPGPPLGTSYAKEIAVQHGISYEQITATLKQRGWTT